MSWFSDFEDLTLIGFVKVNAKPYKLTLWDRAVLSFQVIAALIMATIPLSIMYFGVRDLIWLIGDIVRWLIA